VREPEDFTPEDRERMIAGSVEHYLLTTAEEGLIRTELTLHPELTIPEMAARIASLTGKGTSRGRLSRCMSLVLAYSGWNLPKERAEWNRWLDEAEGALA
jgi:hypothetical protein